MGAGQAPKEYLEREKKKEIEEGTQKTLFGKDPMDRCAYCGKRRNKHIENRWCYECKGSCGSNDWREFVSEVKKE